ncbi:MAG: secretion system protein [Methanomicrobiales archaeon]|nr:secretion system protein [Methanomicrobiales archaeon]
MGLPPALYEAEQKFTDLEIRLHGSGFRTAIRSAHLPVTAEQYLRTCRHNLAQTAAGIILMALFFLITGIDVALLGFSTANPMVWAGLFGILIPGMYAFLVYYPVIVARGRKSRIELDLPYAISYMQALSTTVPPYEMIRRIYEESDMFGEVSREFAMIIRDVELFGDDMITAMRNLQRTTPSPHLRDFLNDLGIVFDSGGDISSYLGAKTEYYRDQARQELELVLKTIEIMAEVYVSAFVAGPIALIIMIVAQGMTNSQGMDWILPLMYVLIPAGAILMIWILSMMLPPENLEVTRKEVVEHDFGGTIPTLETREPDGLCAEDREFFRRIDAQKQRHSVINRLKNPLRTYITSYDYSLVASGIVAGIITAFWFFGWFDTLLPHNPFEGFLCILIIGSMIPVVIAYESRRWYVRNVEAHLPEFLRELSDMKDIGITLQEAIHRISGARLGVLSSELSVASRDIEAGVYVNSALVRMEERIGLVSVKRAISLLVRASEITTNLRQIFIIAITDIEHYLKLKRERANTTIVYVMIIYLSFGIYLYTAYQLNVPFLASFTGQNMNVNIDTAGNLTEMFRIGIILGAFSGIMAGQFSSNSILAGFKHSIVLLSAALGLFVFLM